MPCLATVSTKSWKGFDGGTSKKSTWMSFDAWGEEQPLAVSTTLQLIVVPGWPASNVIWLLPWPAVIAPLVSDQLHVEPTWFATLAVFPVDPTSTKSGAAITGSAGVAV